MHYKYKDECVDEFYRCLYVPIERYHIIDDPWQRNFLGGGTDSNNKNYEESKLQEEILFAKDFALRWQTTDKQQLFKISAKYAKMILPDEFHFSGIIYEI